MDTRSGALVVLAQQGALLRRNLRKPIPIESRRIAIERMITLDFPHCGAFFAEYSSNISMTGMFIRTDRIQPPGTLVKLEFNLSDGSSLIESEAEVVWVRRRNESPDRPSGLGLRFLNLEKESRQLIRWAVEQRLRDGSSSAPEEAEAAPSGRIDDGGAEKAPVTGGDFKTSQGARSSREEKPLQENKLLREVKLVRETGPSQATQPSPGEKTARETESPQAGDELNARLYAYAGARAVQDTGGRWRWRWRWRWAAFAALMVLLTGVLFFLYRGSDPGKVSGVSELEGVAAAVEKGPAAAVVGMEETIATDVESTEVTRKAVDEGPPVSTEPRLESPSPESEIATVIASWAEAWSMQRVDAYLGFYAGSYRPVDGLSLTGWREQRRERLTKPQRIEVGISSLEVQLLDAERARASFEQAYQSDRYRDDTRKTLELVLENGQWKIQEERSET